MSFQDLVRVFVQGMNKYLVPNGSYDVIEIGQMSMDQALSMLNRMPRSYPPNILALDEYCPASIIFENQRASVLIALDTDGSFYAIINDFIRGESNKEVYNLNIEAARKLIVDYLSGRAALEGMRRVEGGFIAKLATRPEITVYPDRIDSISLQDIYRVIIKKPGFLSKAKVIIEYREPALNRIEKLEALIRDKNQIPLIHQILAQVLGPDKIIVQ